MIETVPAPPQEPTAPAQPSAWLAWGWPLAMWAASRLIVLASMAFLAPMLPVPAGGHPVTVDWHLLERWDSAWYHAIATTGYEFAPDGRQHAIAFFPLFPLLIRALMLPGLPFEVAGGLLANVSFLGALLVFHRWVLARHGGAAACWTSALLAWSPYSVFGTVIYTEGLFLLLSGATLAAFERGRYGLAGVLGGLASATRIQGVLLVPALAWSAWREGRPGRAYLAALASGLGLGLFMAFCAHRFGTPLAFLKAQSGWHSAIGFNFQEWANLLTFGLTGPAPENGVLKGLMLIAAPILLVRWRKRLTPAVWAYGILSMGLILASGSFASPDRYVYGALPVALALAFSLERKKGWGLALLGVSAALLVLYSLKMAWAMWVA